MPGNNNDNSKIEVVPTNDELEAIIIDEVLETEQVDDDGNFVLVMRSGKGVVALVFSPEHALEAAGLLTATANAIEED